MLKKNKKTISVVIPVYNALPDLKVCLASLLRTAGGLYQLVLVDNGSGPETRRFLSGLKGAVRIRNRTNLGFSNAVNAGLRAASGDYIAVVNSDVAFYQGGLQGLAACLDADPSAGACGPLTNRTVGVQRVTLDPKLERNRKSLGTFAQALALKFGGEYFEVHRLVGFCFMLRRSAFESVGLLDERFGTGCFEDFDYCLRLRQAGWKLKAAKDVFVWHRQHASFGGHDHFHTWAARNREVFVDKWCRKALEFLDELNPHLETNIKS
ncbi:MAG: glycosyltransferase family 2 protein [Elusimicrobia bacterium]|nr:glycosyltransferase family 2 protein [Elusimicrobiota bacterium]